MPGLDIGTSFIVKAEESKKGVNYTEFRDAFYRLKPNSVIAAKMMEKSLSSVAHFKDSDGSFVLVGYDAIEKAVERHESALRPMHRGIISKREPEARKVLKFIFSQLLGQGSGEKLVYTVPAQPVDQSGEDFDISFHEDVIKKDLGDLGWQAESLGEAEAICYSELENDDYTGVAISAGSGMQNICIMSAGDSVLSFSSTKSGDYVDHMAAQSVNLPDSEVQMIKENTKFKLGDQHDSQVITALDIYYKRLINYTVKQISHQLSQIDNIPKFSKPLPVVIAGGTSLVDGYLEEFEKALRVQELPFAIGEIRYANDRIHAVARGCLIASSL